MKPSSLLGDVLVDLQRDLRLVLAPAADFQEVGQGDGDRCRQEAQQSAHLDAVLHRTRLGERDAAHEEGDRETDTGDTSQHQHVPLGHAHGELEPQGDAEQGHQRDAEWLAQQQTSRHEVRAGVHRGQDHASADEAEQAEHDFHRVLQPGAHVVEGVGFFVLVPREQAAVVVLVRHGPHDRHQRQCRVNPAFVEAVPAERAREQVPAPGGDPKVPVHEPADGQGEHHRSGEHHVVGLSNGVEHREDAQAATVVRHREQQQKGDGRVAFTEDESGDQVREGDVRGRRDGPTAHEVRVENSRAGRVEEGRASHATDGGEQRQGRGAEVAEGATGERALPDFLRREGEEEGHQHLVDGEVELVRDVLVELVVDVGEQKGRDGPHDEEERVLDEKPPPLANGIDHLEHLCQVRAARSGHSSEQALNSPTGR